MLNQIEDSVGNLTEKDIFILQKHIDKKYGTGLNSHGPLRNAILELVYELNWEKIMIFLVKAPVKAKDAWDGHLKLVQAMRPNVSSFKAYAMTVIFNPQR